jgi:glycosyltransferase involved in cell wall biosynthesis
VTYPEDRRRVLVVPKWYPWPDRPVFGIFCREQARAIASANEVVVLASDAVQSPSFRAFELSDSVEDGIRTMRLRYRRPVVRPAAMGFNIQGAVAALRRLRRDGFRPDVVHAHVYSAALPAFVLARLSRAPLVVSEHYTGFQRGLVRGSDRLVAKTAFRRADLLAPVSEDLASTLRPLAPETPMRVVPNVVDTEVFHPPAGPREGGPVRLLSVGWLAEKKGHADLLEALARLDRDDVVLDLVGEGELRAQLEDRAHALGLAERVRFLGPRLREEVAEHMREADLFVLPSHFENLPVVLIEAMASGLPSVATRVGGVPELIDEAVGTLVPARDADALAGGIASTLKRLAEFDPATLAQRARERYGYETVGGIWGDVYDSLSKSGSASSATTRATTSRS